MKLIIKNAARGLGRHLINIMPPSRIDWAAGMEAEIEAIDDPVAALLFALGCVRTGYGCRLRTLSGILAALQLSIAAVTFMFSMLVLTNALWAIGMTQQNTLISVMAGLGLAFLLASLILMRCGPGALAVMSAVMLGLNTLGLWVTNKVALFHTDSFRALVLEGYFLWSMLLLAGLMMHHAAHSNWLARLARDNGWNG